MRHITATVDLDASPERVWAVLADTGRYPAWNPFITRIAGTLAVGEKLDIRIAPPGGKPMSFHPTVTDVQPLLRLAWLGHLGFPGLFDGAIPSRSRHCRTDAPNSSRVRSSVECWSGSPASSSPRHRPALKPCTPRSPRNSPRLRCRGPYRDVCEVGLRSTPSPITSGSRFAPVSWWVHELPRQHLRSRNNENSGRRRRRRSVRARVAHWARVEAGSRLCCLHGRACRRGRLDDWPAARAQGARPALPALVLDEVPPFGAHLCQ